MGSCPLGVGSCYFIWVIVLVAAPDGLCRLSDAWQTTLKLRLHCSRRNHCGPAPLTLWHSLWGPMGRLGRARALSLRLPLALLLASALSPGPSLTGCRYGLICGDAWQLLAARGAPGVGCRAWGGDWGKALGRVPERRWRQ